MVTLKSIEMYSENAKKVLTWDISTVEDKSSIGGTNEDGSPIFGQVVQLKSGDEIQLLSPNFTDKELQNMAEEANRGVK